MSEIVQPAAVSISASASRNDTPRRAAKRRPIELLLAPIMPTNATVRFNFMPFDYTHRCDLASGTCGSASISATNGTENVSCEQGILRQWAGDHGSRWGSARLLWWLSSDS